MAETEVTQTTTLADTVEARLKQYIFESGLGIGDSLPGEIELAQKLSVSRAVVREALSRLRMVGLLDSRKRRGLVVAHPDPFNSLECVPDPSFLTETARLDFAEMRLALEVGMAEFMFARGKKADLTFLERIVRREEGAPDDLDVRLEGDVQFHQRLFRMAGNRALLQLHPLMSMIFDTLRRTAPGLRGPHVHPDHRDLLEILRGGTGAEFRDAMRGHLKPHYDRFMTREEPP